MARFLRRAPLAPFTLPVFVNAPVWSANMLRVTLPEIVPVILAMLAFIALIYAVIYALVRSGARASLMTLIWAGYCFYLPALLRSVTESTALILVGVALGALLAFDLSRRVPSEAEAAEKANRIGNIALGVVALITLAPLVLGQIKLENGRPDPAQSFAAFPGKAGPQAPDVWHIVMDRYAGARTMASAYGYDNTPFLAELERRGFNVAGDAYSNYHITPLSLASTLNAAYLDGYVRRSGRSDDLVTMFNAIDRNQAFAWFKRSGYEIVFSGSWADVTVRNSQADRTINFRGASEIPRIALLHSVPGTIGEAFGMPYTDGRTDQCLRVKHKFRELTKIAREPGRKYVFAHFLIPHPPYVLDEAGNCLSVEEAGRKGRKRAYAEMVRYANAQLLDLIDTIRAGPRPATIILHADEGPYPRQFAADEPEFPIEAGDPPDYQTAGVDARRQKTGIILAIRHADGAREPAPRTPVNIYPAVLNHSFGTTMPMLEDKVLLTPPDLDLRKARDFSAELFDRPAGG